MCSFDVFDTVLTRTVTPPSAVFYQVGCRASASLSGDCSPSQFAHLRKQAEKRATVWKGPSTSLKDIYSELQSSLQLSDNQTSVLRNLEVAVEEEVLYPVSATIQEIERCRENGASIVFTSDMYLPSNFIRNWLKKHEIWRPGDRLFVSCEHGMTKHGGRLFRPIKCECEGGKTLVHFGNSVDADVDGAEAAGITPYRVTKANPNRYEQILEGFAEETTGASARLAGASRYARLHATVETRHEKALRDVTAGVMAPILVGFVTWLLRCSREQDLDCLYFTSRDGYHLLPIARGLRSVLDIDCDVEYLHVSRAVLAAASTDPEKIESSWSDYEKPSGKELLARMGLKYSDVQEYISSEKEKREILSNPITSRGKEIIKNIIRSIYEEGHYVEKRNKVIKYLKQKGISDNLSFGLVDIGWKGTVHMFLNEILIEEGVLSDPVRGFFFGLNEEQQPYAGYRQSYFFDKHRGKGIQDPIPENSISDVMEMFCTAPHGTVTGYTEENVQVAPVFEPKWSDRMEAWGLPVVERTLHTYIDGIVGSPELIGAGTDIRQPLSDLLRAFWMDPSPSEAAAWGAFPMELGQGEGIVQPLSEPYNELRGPFTFFKYGRRAADVIKHERSWLEGALEQSNPWFRGSIRGALRGREALKYTLYGIAHKVNMVEMLERFTMSWIGDHG